MVEIINTTWEYAIEVIWRVKGGDCVGVFVVESYVIKPEKQEDFAAYKRKWKKFFAFEKKLPLLREVKSHRLFAQLFGGNFDGYVELWEFEGLADVEKFFGKIMKSDYMTKLAPEFVSLVVPGSRVMSIWSSVE